MKCLITGADGFIGSHLTESLLSKDYEVVALSQYNSFNNWGWLEKINKKNLNIISGDIRDQNFCKKISKGVDIIFHLAALISIPYSYESPESYIDTNIKGTLNICNAALENNISRLIHTSTSEVYGTAKYIPIDENHPLQPQSPYSASKIGADSIAMSFYKSFNLPLTIVRPFNTYGPRQSARAVIPNIITQIASGADKIKLGDVTPTRDFNYVLDVCNAIIAISNKKKTIGETINIGSNFEISIEETFNLIKKLMNSDAKLVSDKSRLRPLNSEVYRLYCDNQKLINLTGFLPKFNIKKGLKLTIDWFSQKQNLKYYKTNIYNV